MGWVMPPDDLPRPGTCTKSEQCWWALCQISSSAVQCLQFSPFLISFLCLEGYLPTSSWLKSCWNCHMPLRCFQQVPPFIKNLPLRSEKYLQNALLQKDTSASWLCKTTRTSLLLLREEAPGVPISVWNLSNKLLSTISKKGLYCSPCSSRVLEEH